MEDMEIKFLKNKANKIRLHSLKMTTEANSGHPTSSFSCAEIMSVLFFKQMNYDPQDMNSKDNDEFILSKGHAAPALYAAYVEAGILGEKDIMSLRKFGSPIEGHPVPRIPGVKIATGSLGQGLSAGVGMAIAMKMDKIKRKVYVLLGDGESQEGSVWEGMSLASDRKLGNLFAILDMNRLGQSDPTMHEWDSKNYLKKAKAFGWNAVEADGHSVEDIIKAFGSMKKSKPTFIVAKTVKGKGVSFLENKDGKHGKAVSKDEYEKARKEIEEKITEINFENKNTIKAKSRKPAEKKFSISTNYNIGSKMATREAYGQALVKLGKQNPDVMVLDADVKNSTFTEFFFEKFPKRSIECYIAEQNMIGVAAGLQARGKKPFAATFAAFLTRAFDQVRMANYSRADIKIAGSHTGVSIGEDGPSQMGLEDIGMMRPLLNSVVLYPSDAVSSEKLTAESANYNGISYIRTTRSGTPVIYDNSEEFRIGGSKTLKSSDKDSVTIVSAGITLHEALKAAGELEKESIKIRVIDLYSIKPLDIGALEKAASETKAVLAVEDHYQEGGIGEAVAFALSGKCTVHTLAVKKMPHSGSPEELLREQGLDSSGIINKVKEILN